MVKNCDLGLEMLPLAYGLRQYFQDLSHSFSAYGPASRQITYIYEMYREQYKKKICYLPTKGWSVW